MIIEALLNLIYLVLTGPLSLIHIPQIPSDILNTVNSTIDLMLTRAAELIELVLPYNIVKVLLGIVIAIELGIMVYKFILWILKKIPMGGIS